MNVAAEHHLGIPMDLLEKPAVREVMGGLILTCVFLTPVCVIRIPYAYCTYTILGGSADGPESAQDIEHRRRETQAGARVSRAGHRDGGDRPAAGRPCLGAQAPRGPPF